MTCGVIEKTIFIGHHVQIAEGVQKFTRPEQKIGIGGLAHALVALGKGLVEQHATRCHALHDVPEQRSPKIIADHHRAKLLAGKWPGGRFQIGLQHLAQHRSGLQGIGGPVHAQLQSMRGMQAQAQALQSRPKVSYDDASRMLATLVKKNLGAQAQITMAGERATVTMKAVPPEALVSWLAQVRVDAHALPIESRLTRNTTDTKSGWDGVVVLVVRVFLQVDRKNRAFKMNDVMTRLVKSGDGEITKVLDVVGC